MRRTPTPARWWRTAPWPAYILGTTLANVVGAVFLYLLLRLALPPVVNDLAERTLPLFVASVLVGTAVAILSTELLIAPILCWQLQGTTGPDAQRARIRAIRLPTLQTLYLGAVWLIAGVLFTVVAARSSGALVVVTVVSVLLGGAASCTLSYLFGERILRPITTAALSEGVPGHVAAPKVGTRIVLVWGLGTGIPVLGILLVAASRGLGSGGHDQPDIRGAVIALSVAALVFGLLAIRLVAGAVADPVQSLHEGVRRVRGGDLSATVKVYDTSQLGALQAGFNDMVAGLAERDRLRDLFGRYVGEDVARRALERGTTLSGEERNVAVLFVDLVGSTGLAAHQGAESVAALLNRFFRVVVEVIAAHGGYVNKFEGDAALAVFGAPIEHGNAYTGALRAARELHTRLAALADAGIGVSSGRVFAGHIGAAERFEYTVVGDPVNEAARLTDLAKSAPGAVLAAADTVGLAGDDEARHWTVTGSTLLRGRTAPTRLARPRAVESP
ncbi:adenylate/guanylate cyclase domain-containing protein [Rhodococcus sp. D2-41]|uniref:Adenylate/guanylate cyclase domain-containing protein n=1 Tax=Speluncibacter jeojiensis TaxID=2710754 RepID=A0A9X4M4M1_9ACTN|nr:adenylate/guanylate cyclase domain-containing protein [Rhodococcus sp. D2-41]MDG3009364.1 adenylate/guanylate cyclase domain-containing protein [Rhodococcus sp. D2-41]MDG3017081.1 adenylate/guanylate cyclase domain-containing protein [Corynebacteriales bacterium D3-21]